MMYPYMILADEKEIVLSQIIEKDGMKKVYPEYESVVRLCKERGAAFQDVFESVKQAIEK